MNQKNYKNRTVNSRMTRILTFVVALVMSCVMSYQAQAQISYSQDFTGCDAASCNGWTISGGFSPTYYCHSGSGYSSCSGPLLNQMFIPVPRGNAWLQQGV